MRTRQHTHKPTLTSHSIVTIGVGSIVTVGVGSCMEHLDQCCALIWIEHIELILWKRRVLRAYFKLWSHPAARWNGVKRSWNMQSELKQNAWKRKPNAGNECLNTTWQKISIQNKKTFVRLVQNQVEQMCTRAWHLLRSPLHLNRELFNQLRKQQRNLKSLANSKGLVQTPQKTIWRQGASRDCHVYKVKWDWHGMAWHGVAVQKDARMESTLGLSPVLVRCRH